MSGTQALLSEYANGGSEKAFRELVSAYISFVFSTALRIVGGDRPLAEDVTQTVFTDLARKAALLPKNVQLGGWLHRHTCFVARNTLRRERRRIARERAAVEMNSTEDYTEANLGQVALVLDEVINDLSAEDRSAIMLRFFEEMDFRSIGEALGSTEDAARMRVSRAVEKMGALLKRRGMVLTVAAITFVLSGRLATAAPAGLATRIVYVELARPMRGPRVFEIIREACFSRLNVGLVSAAVIVGLLALLLSGRRSGAKALPAADGKTFTPAEFADLAVDDSDAQDAVNTEVASTEPQPSPAPTVAPATAVPLKTLTVKPAVISVPRATTPQIVAQPTPSASVPVDNNVGANQAVGRMQGNQYGNSWGQGRGIYIAPRAGPQTFPSKVTTNNPNSLLVRNPPNLNVQNEPWAPTRTMASTEPATTAVNPSAGRPSVQSAPSTQRTLPPSRSNDPRKRDRRP
jgi:RNA polymerase sigma factor, sigma-70 family